MRSFRHCKITVKYIFVISILFTVIFYAFMQYNNRGINRAVQLNFYKENHRFLDAINATSCKLPQYDLYDPEIRVYVDKQPAPIDCGNIQPYLTYMDWDGNLFLNQTELEMNRYTDLTCTYEKVIGDKINDYIVSYECLKEIKIFPVKVVEPVIRVKCTDDGVLIYTMIHSQIQSLSDEVIKKNKAIPKHRPSVLIFVIDSMSRGNFIRALPKTYEYLRNKHKMQIFKGLNKVADNTFPNMMALLTGFLTQPRSDMPHMPIWTIKLNSTLKRYDDMPIIWKPFKDSGYITMYAEEYLDATFSLLDVGFQNDPVDYYYRSSYVSLQENLSKIKRGLFSGKSKSRYCLANHPSYKYILNYTEEFLIEMADYRYFALSFFVEMSHDSLNDVKNMDNDLFNFFQKLFGNGMFKNTMILVMGDHGHRFDAIRSTFIGRIEERMPFLGIILPETLRTSHPHLEIALESHTERLLSWYDIHETLVDVSVDNINKDILNLRPNAIGKSLFKIFDDNRTCTEIGILPEYCMCDREARILPTSSKALEAADIIVRKLNDLLKDAPQYVKSGDTQMCAPLKLQNVLSATASMRSFSSGMVSLLIRVILEVSPSNGRFEAAVEYLPLTSPQVLGDINRINKYGSQPSCISHDILRLYCYCVQ